MNSSLKAQIKALIFSHLSHYSRDIIFQTLRRSKTEALLHGTNFVIDCSCGSNTKMITKKITSLAGTRSLRYKCNHTDFMVVGPTWLKSQNKFQQYHSQETALQASHGNFLEILQRFLDQEADWVKKRLDEYLKSGEVSKAAVLETALEGVLENYFGRNLDLACLGNLSSRNRKVGWADSKLQGGKGYKDGFNSTEPGKGLISQISTQPNSLTTQASDREPPRERAVQPSSAK